MNVVVGMLTTIVLIAQNLRVQGSLVFGLSFVLVGLVFAGVALVAAQITDNTRLVYGSAGAVLGASFVLRAIGDIGSGTASWFSPIGIAQKTRPLRASGGGRSSSCSCRSELSSWRPASCLPGAISAEVWSPRVRDRLRRHGASGVQFGLALRLQRGTLAGWGLAVVVTGIAYGWIGPPSMRLSVTTKRSLR